MGTQQVVGRIRISLQLSSLLSALPGALSVLLITVCGLKFAALCAHELPPGTDLIELDNALLHFQVTNVEADDSLNVRDAPSVKGNVIGGLPPDSKPIEVVSYNDNKTWGRINFEGESGWVSMAYLKPVELPTLSNSNVPFPLVCAGTEPYWTFNVHAEDSATYTDPERSSSDPLEIQALLSPSNTTSQSLSIISKGWSSSATALLKPAYCSNGQSDNLYRWQIDLLIVFGGEHSWLQGCCRIPR